MPARYIDFISEYCDKWCERCAFTDRCSSFAVTTAIPMCDGDIDAEIELAVGPSCVPGQAQAKTLGGHMMEAALNETSEKELEEIGRELQGRRRRVRRHSLSEASRDYAVAVHRWFDSRHAIGAHAHPSVREAVDVVGWDSSLIPAKINRALSGRDEGPRGWFGEGPAQRDWNGSAKVAVISLERTERAWRVVAAATGDESATALGDAAAALHQQICAEFPKAMKFLRPGFDDRR